MNSGRRKERKRKVVYTHFFCRVKGSEMGNKEKRERGKKTEEEENEGMAVDGGKETDKREEKERGLRGEEHRNLGETDTRRPIGM